MKSIYGSESNVEYPTERWGAHSIAPPGSSSGFGQPAIDPPAERTHLDHPSRLGERAGLSSLGDLGRPEGCRGSIGLGLRTSVWQKRWASISSQLKRSHVVCSRTLRSPATWCKTCCSAASNEILGPCPNAIPTTGRSKSLSLRTCTSRRISSIKDIVGTLGSWPAKRR